MMSLNGFCALQAAGIYCAGTFGDEDKASSSFRPPFVRRTQQGTMRTGVGDRGYKPTETELLFNRLLVSRRAKDMSCLEYLAPGKPGASREQKAKQRKLSARARAARAVREERLASEEARRNLLFKRVRILAPTSPDGHWKKGDIGTVVPNDCPDRYYVKVFLSRNVMLYVAFQDEVEVL